MAVYGHDGLPLVYRGMGGFGVCRSCRNYFERFRCVKLEDGGKCDCPRCKCYCRCKREEVVYYE